MSYRVSFAPIVVLALAACAEGPPPVARSQSDVVITPVVPPPPATAAPTPAPNPAASAVPPTASTTTRSDGLQIIDTRIGTGDEAIAGARVSVHYVGTFDDGTKFDSSRDRDRPFEFGLGHGQVIKGWDRGVIGMRVGGIRTLVIPPALAYGDHAAGPIPAGSTLHFEIELLSVTPFSR